MNKRRRHKAKARRRWLKRENDFASARGWSRDPNDHYAREDSFLPVRIKLDALRYAPVAQPDRAAVS